MTRSVCMRAGGAGVLATVLVVALAVPSVALAAVAAVAEAEAEHGADTYRVEQRIAQLRALQRLTLSAETEAGLLQAQSRELTTALARSQRTAAAAQAALGLADGCVPRLQMVADALQTRLVAAGAAQSHSRTAVASLSQQPAEPLGPRVQRADQAFTERSSAEVALQHAATAWQSMVFACENQTAVADDAARKSAGTVRALRRQAAALPERSRRVKAIWSDAKAAGVAAANHGWMAPTAVSRVTPALDDAPVEALAGRLGPLPPASSSADPATPAPRLYQMPADVAALAAQRARLADAAAMADALFEGCGTVEHATEAAAGCAGLTLRREALAHRMAAASQRLLEAREAVVQWMLTQRTRNAAQRAAASTAQAELAALSVQIEAAAVASLRVGTEALRAALELQAQVEPAIRVAVQRAGGTGAHHPPDTAVGEGADSATDLPMPAPEPDRTDSAATAAPSLPPLVSHAWAYFDRLNGERDGFGAYTYVLLRSASDLQQPAVLRRYTRLLAVVQRERRGAGVSVTEAPFINLFCIPGHEGGTTAQQLAQNYDDDLSLQLLFRAQSGLLTRPEMQRRLRDAPGPFLLTLPVRIGDAHATTPLLFADLSGFPDDAIADLVGQYKGSLLVDFPRQQAAWKPPVPQRVALVMIGFASDVGNLVMSVMPAALAGER